jgi:hypothetical protein
VEPPQAAEVARREAAEVARREAAVVECPRAAVVELREAAVAESPKPAPAGTPKPIVVEPPKPAVVEPPKLAVVEPSKAAEEARPKPAALEPPKAAARHRYHRAGKREPGASRPQVACRAVPGAAREPQERLARGAHPVNRFAATARSRWAKAAMTPISPVAMAAPPLAKSRRATTALRWPLPAP